MSFVFGGEGCGWGRDGAGSFAGIEDRGRKDWILNRLFEVVLDFQGIW